MIPHSNEHDESGFYSQNDFIMTNSNSNTPNSGGFHTNGTQRRGNNNYPPVHQNYYAHGGAQYVREQAEDEDDEELSSAYMSKNYGASSHHP